MSYLVGIGPSARALELMDTSTRAIPPTATPEFRDQYAHARGSAGSSEFSDAFTRARDASGTA